MNNRRWREETDLTKLVLKLNEEVGEVTQAFNKEKRQTMTDELDDVSLIVERLKEVL